MSGFSDHGHAFRGDGFEPEYAPPPRFTVHAHADDVGRLAYQMKQEANDAAIHAARLVKLTEQRFAREAMQSQELSEAMDACAKALADAIEKLTGKRAA